MTAQQQLAELIRKFPRDDQWDVDACVFIRDHGPAIAELIEAVEAMRKFECIDSNFAAAFGKATNASAKLTEPK